MRKVDGREGCDSWIESELTRQFCQVRAPESLWQRIHEQQRPLRSRHMQTSIWLSIAAALMIGCAALAMLLASEHYPTSSDLQRLSQLEVRRIVNGDGAMDLNSHSAREIRAWVRRKADIDIRIPERREVDGKTVRLFGARLTYVKGLPVAAIPYEVDGHFAAMLVMVKRGRANQTEERGHVMQRVTVAGDIRFVSWEMGKEAYTIASADVGEHQRECLLCHIDSQRPGGRM